MIFFLRSLFLVVLVFANTIYAATSVEPNPPLVERLESVGVMFQTNYRTCPNLAVKADLYYINEFGEAEFQNRCFVNSATSAVFPEVGYCYFRKPLEAGLSGSKIFIRLWKTDSACTQYNDETGNVKTGYVDHPLTGNISHSVAYRALKENRLITIDKANYSLKLDRNGGATYEFYNKKAERDGNTFLANSIHAHNGAALQVAIHNHAPVKLMPNTCDSSQGYWNPTQAGYYCAHLPDSSENYLPNAPAPGSSSGLKITCDANQNDNCQFASNEVIFSKYKMYNWDYSPTFPGPYNAQIDKGYLSQIVKAHDNYVTYDLTFENKWQPFSGPIEIPTYYFTNVFRKYTYGLNNKITTITIGDHRDSTPTYRTADNNIAIDWISFENTSGVSNDHFTIAWMYMPDMSEDIVQAGYGVVETDAFGAIKFTNQPIINFKTNKEYRMRYVVFPYRYDTLIASEFGLKKVSEVITEMKSKYVLTTLSPTAPTLNFEAVKTQNPLWPGSYAFDGSKTSAYSSHYFPTAKPANDLSLHLSYNSGPKTLSEVKIYARNVQGVNLGFPVKYNFYINNSSNTGWELISSDNKQPDQTGLVHITFPSRPVHGILIVPVELGKDNQGDYYFQLAEIIPN